MKEENQSPGFDEPDQTKSAMKEENQDLGFTDQHYDKFEIKEEKHDPDFLDQHYDKIEIKEENQDPEYIEQGYYRIVIKDESNDLDFIDQDNYKIELKEEDQEPDIRTSDPAGPSHQQVSICTCSNRSLHQSVHVLDLYTYPVCLLRSAEPWSTVAKCIYSGAVLKHDKGKNPQG
ncbi:hypothetical protein Q8A73_012462 [Channa argus]|nr:hypothetical protein Q8A73_012462 [Channa argus]